ncbi:hypothetical protein PENTCL1PPCAC_13838, partial [Pristionchus entomophagus]
NHFRDMAGRGRSVPNLSLAGMREEKGASNGQQNRGRGRGRGRGGRGGRGRGGGGGGAGKPRQELIQTMGVFSDGLHAEDRKKERIKLEFEGGAHKRIKEETTTIADMTKSQVTSARGYAEMWESEESADEEELKEILNGGFLSDVRSGRVLPLVTPIEEEAQFKGCMAKDEETAKVKKEIMSDEEDEKPRVTPPHDEEDDPFPTLTRSQAAAGIVERMMEAGSSDLLLLQIPSIVPILARATVDARRVPDDPTAPETAPCSSGLPRGKRVGSMRATADGGVEMRIGGQRLTLTKNIGGATGYCDTLAMVEVPPSALASTESSGMFGGRPSAPSGASVSHLGNIQHHMVAALDWTTSLAESRRAKREGGEGEKKHNGEMEMSTVKREIASPTKTADRAALETRMEAVAKRRAERAKFLNKWGTQL